MRINKKLYEITNFTHKKNRYAFGCGLPPLRFRNLGLNSNKKSPRGQGDNKV